MRTSIQECVLEQGWSRGRCCGALWRFCLGNSDAMPTSVLRAGTLRSAGDSAAFPSLRTEFQFGLCVRANAVVGGLGSYPLAPRGALLMVLSRVAA